MREGGKEASSGDGGFVLCELVVAAELVGVPEGIPVKSLLVRLWITCGSSGRALSCLISSRVGACPRYQADGDDGGGLCANLLRSSGNIGFGLCMLPSEPLRRRDTDIP